MKTLAVLIALAATLATCDAFSCYSCSGSKSSSCGEIFRASSSYTVYCYTACYKTVSTVDSILGSSTTYSRGCTSRSSYSLTCSSGSAGYFIASGSTETCYCGSSLCNSASNLLPSIIQIVVFVSAVLFFQKF
ncbi:uncharacterized protein LOC106176627 [Lingula anatina]|uniref:Uncharacterized protein LOC106176627 n=1 Tax=Lingula anatina TaxID=7574 RepID=A0A1S3JW66_LINAN|nr:uncharacterized protein LOC106176627 [Lingula anatina]|eukprot:XP_013414547.1 uncharacterized protein LOC106176627 [Lingula anatina]